MQLQRSGLPLMLLAGLLLIAAALGVVLVADRFSEDRLSRPASPEEWPEPAPPAARDAPDPPAPAVPAPAPAPEPAPVPEPPPAAPAQQTIPASTHTVRRTDTLYDLAEAVWADPFLWPILFQANEDRTPDPDYLRPGQTIRIPEWVTVESGLTAQQRMRLSQAHVLAYRYYRDLGSEPIGLGAGQPEWWLSQLGRIRMNKAMWVLYSGMRYDEAILDRFAPSVRPEDARQVRAFVDRFGLPPGRR